MVKHTEKELVHNNMAYSEKVVDHYENPRNVGSFDKSDTDIGTGMVGAPACGDVLDKTTEYRVIFTPINNTTDILGLTSISTTDAVNKAGKQLKVIIK